MKRSSFVPLVAALSVTLFSVAAAQDTPEPEVTELGSGGTQITFWNGLSGSDGVTLNQIPDARAVRQRKPGYFGSYRDH